VEGNENQLSNTTCFAGMHPIYEILAEPGMIRPVAVIHIHAFIGEYQLYQVCKYPRHRYAFAFIGVGFCQVFVQSIFLEKCGDDFDYGLFIVIVF